jgi:EH_Signature domain
MTSIQEGLQCLSSDLADFREAMLSRPVDPVSYLRQLEKAVQALEAKSSKLLSPKPPLNAEEVWAQWQESNYDFGTLDAREVRTLCVSPATAMQRRLIKALTIDPTALKRRITFIGFVQAYFSEWRSMDEPHAVEELIKKMLGVQNSQRSNRSLDVWRKYPLLFSAEASRFLGEVIIRDKRPVKQACADLFIESSTPVALAAHKQAVALAVTQLIQRAVRVGQDAALSEFQWLSENLLTKSLSPDAYRDAISKLIVSPLAESMPIFQSALVSLIHGDERLGDPRIAYSSPNWRTVAPEARERFLAWLAKDTLQFFFETLVPKNDSNRRRADFWLEYAKKQGKIKDFQVAVSEDDRYKIRASRAKTIPRFSSVTGGKTSAFLMVFAGYDGDYVIIEFSETGNAAYIYARKAFEASGVTLRSLSFRLSQDLKRMNDAEDRIVHQMETKERWESKARRKLAELGIRP